MSSYIAYAGFTNGTPQVDNVDDSYGDCKKFEIFKRKKDAQARYEDVRKIEIRETARYSPTRWWRLNNES